MYFFILFKYICLKLHFQSLVENTRDKLNRLRRTLKTALTEFQRLRERHDQQLQKHQQLLVEKHALENELSLLKEQVKTIKLAQAIQGGDDQSTRELKNQINRYIREVDRCLDLIKRD
jgi:vacuolar-type H+-ATPase subunit D/Vma8